MAMSELGSSVPSPDRLVVGLDLGFLGAPRTGIANYAAHMVLAAIDLEPSLRYPAFLNSRWVEATPALLRDFTEEGRSDAAPRRRSSADYKGVVTRQVREVLSRSSSVRAVYRLARRAAFAASVNSQHFALFHAYNYQPPADPGVPVLPVVYDLSVFRFPDAHPAERVRLLSPLVKTIAAAPLVQTISEFSKREIVELFGYPADRIFVASPAAAKVFAPRGDDVTERGLEPFQLWRGGFFLSVGTLEPRKNIRTLIAAYGRLAPAERASCPLVIVGGKGWGDLGLSRDADALQSEGSLRFLRGVANPQLRSLYEGARLVLMPSIYEGFGMPVVEAMACGAPVAYSAGTAMEEIATGLGPAVPALDVDGWTQVLRDALANDDQFHVDAREARIVRAKEFVWARSATAVVDAYRRIIRR